MPPQNQPPEQLPTQDYSLFPPQDRLQRPVEFTAPPQGQTRPQPRGPAENQPRVSRRALLRGGLLGGGIGLAVAAGAGAAVGITRSSSQVSLKPVSKPVVMAPMAPNATQGPLVVYISDASSGVLDVYAGTGGTQIHDPALVAQILASLK